MTPEEARRVVVYSIRSLTGIRLRPGDRLAVAGLGAMSHFRALTRRIRTELRSRGYSVPHGMLEAIAESATVRAVADYIRLNGRRGKASDPDAKGGANSGPPRRRFPQTPPKAGAVLASSGPPRHRRVRAPVKSPSVGRTRVPRTRGGRDSERQPAAADVVRCSVFAPASVKPGAVFIVQAFAHLSNQDKAVQTMAIEFDAAASVRAARTLDHAVARGTELTLCLSMTGVAVDEPVQRLTWRGRAEAVQFIVTVAASHAGRDIVGTVHVMHDSVPFGHVKFIIHADRASQTHPPEAPRALAEATWKRYTRAFISYASADRVEVLKRVQMLALASISFYQDVLSVEPGERWARSLYKHIDESDVFFLFWSRAARDSEWVMKETQYAMARQGADGLAPPEIIPVIIEGPPHVAPPDTLSHLHFNDRLIYFIRGAS